MIDYDPIIVSALTTILPTYDELTLHAGIKTPCISYQETNNYADAEGDTIGYSRISYTVKVWGTDKKELKKYMLMVDAVLRPLGFKRVSKNELGDRNSSMRQLILTYEGLALEEF